MSTHDYRTRDEIVISVKSKAQADRDRAKPKKKGSVPPPKTDPRFLPRRKHGGIIKFYDLGQKSDGHGHWTQNNFSHDPVWVVNPPVTTGNDGLAASQPVTITTIRAFEASILTGVLRADFETTFRKIHKSDGNAFPVSFNGTFYNSDDWIEDGMKISQVQLDDIYANNELRIGVRRDPNPAISTAGGGQDYLTIDLDLVPDPTVFGSTTRITGPYIDDRPAAFTDPATGFNPGLNDSFFLMPHFSHDLGQSQSGLITVYQNNFLHMVHRDFTNELNVQSAAFADPGWSAALAYHQAASYARTFTVTGTPDGPFTRLAITPGGTFPFGGGADFTEIRFYPRDDIGQGSAFQYLGQLIAIIKQDSKFFYCWEKISNSVEP